MRKDVEVLLANGLVDSAAIRQLRREVSEGSKLAVIVLYTDASGTLAAMRMAGWLSRDLDALINLVAFQVVPLELELTRPAVAVGWLEERLRALASKVPGETRVDIILCRDARWALRQVLTPHSLVVIGTRRRWWRTKEHRLAEGLQRDGHQVISAYLQ